MARVATYTDSNRKDAQAIYRCSKCERFEVRDV